MQGGPGKFEWVSEPEIEENMKQVKQVKRDLIG